jgi:hypothetical protein
MDVSPDFVRGFLLGVFICGCVCVIAVLVFT